ncbi:redoxin domain-containing protein [Chitinophaga sedimenti]|uniref:redoxin domain-containing protein n=1 Tax=Chitinophaga sedimenti TaxID=2033606 RepID=UPI0020056A00|nr:TlpA disulfide reductase family protein [Chitinophaga sedimenti]MCK7555521.1 redoxin domain-containing protein [Chitinophaga sedimenti]
MKTINYVSILGRSMMNVDNAAADKFVKKHIDALKDTATTQSYYSLLSLYSEILVKGKKNDQALTYAEQAYTKLNRKDPELEKNYAVLLAQKGRYADAVPVLEKLVETGRANDVVRTQLRTSYKKTKVSDGDAKIAALDAKFLDNMKEEVAKKLISKTAPAFEVKDITGKTVSLADFKGKTIVIDFWATWCGPCKKSFPAMQLAVNKYKNDPNVKFLFVHTWERGTETPQKDAADYPAQNKYSFDLYMDTKDEKSQKNPAVSAFEVTGIPTKFIIDGKGNIRFNVVGFSGAGGDESAATELATMIEMVKGA